MPAIIKCKKCGKICNSNRDLKIHLARRFACDAKEHQCGKCGKSLSCEKTRKEHEKICKGPVKSVEEQLTDAEAKLRDLGEKLASKIAREEIIENENDQEVSSPLELISDQPEWMKPLDKTLPKTIGIIDADRPQIYIMVPEKLLKPFENIIGFPLKLGSSDNPYSRIMSQHRLDFGGAKLLDSIICNNPSAVETKLKRWLSIQDRFIACKTPKKKTTETEVVVVEDHADYERIYRKAISFAEEYDRKNVAKDEMKSSFEEMAAAVNVLRQQVASLSIT